MVASLLACCVAGVKAQDTDGDGMPDAWETTWYLNPNDPADAAVDFDLDGLTSLQEYELSLQGKGQGPIGVWTWETVPIEPSVQSRGLGALNDNDDVVVGASMRRSSDGAWRKISTVNGVSASIGINDLNNHGEVVGSVGWPHYFGFRKTPFAGAPSTDVSPYYLPGESASPVGVISRVNNSGDIIGKRADGTSFFHKAVGGLVSAPSGWGALTYSALNDLGQAAGSEAGAPTDFGATSHFVLSGLSSWHAPFPAYAANEINTSEIDPPEMSLETLYAPRFLNNRGEFAEVYRWRIGNPEEEEKFYNEGIYHFDGTGYKRMLPTTGHTLRPQVYDMNNHSQALISGSDEYGDNMSVYLHRKGVNVPLEAMNPMVPSFTYGYDLPARINNRSTIVGVTGNSIYFLRLSQDEDGDGMPDDWEEFYELNRLDPNDAGIDSDGDGYPNLMEFRFGGDPNDPAVHSGPSTHPVLTLIDTDGDGIPDEWERRNFPTLSSPWCDPNADADGDGLTNLVESYFSSNPNAADSDGDGLLDALEMQAGTNPQLADSDGDGISDLIEVNAGSGGSSGATNPAQTSWPERRFYSWGQWYSPENYWSYPYLSVDTPDFKIGWTRPADKDYHFQVSVVTMIGTGEEEEYEIESVEPMVMTIAKGALESNAISTFQPIGSPRIKYLLATHVEFLRPEGVKYAVPWGLSEHQRIIPRPEVLQNGIWARVKNDDDNENEIPDAGETSNPDENDLIKVKLWVDYMSEFIIRKPVGVKIWEDKARTVLVSDSHETTKVISPMWHNYTELWIECVVPVIAGDLEFSQKDSNDPTEVLISKTPIRTYDKLAVGVSGELQIWLNGVPNTPAGWNKEAATQGLFEVCRNLYLKGYNIHYFAEPQINSGGSGAGHGQAFNEIHDQVLTGGVKQLVAFGYSHGGSGCWQMLDKLSTSLVAGLFTVRMTAYVDAITRGGRSSETRYPPLSISHWNAYQRNTGLPTFLNGNSVTGAWPGAGGANVSYLGVVHAGPNAIHKHPTVKTLLETELELKMK